MKYYEVLVKGFCAIVVRAESEKQATQFAMDDLSTGNFQIEEVETHTLGDTEVESSKRHADFVIEE